jgi:RNA polymerase II subunit A-like phosphatase
MASPATTLHTPDGLEYPIQIRKRRVEPGGKVSRGSALCDYSFEYKVMRPRIYDATGVLVLQQPIYETRYGTWESPIEGTFQKWLVRPGDVIPSREHATKNPAATIMYESCLRPSALISAYAEVDTVKRARMTLRSMACARSAAWI